MKERNYSISDYARAKYTTSLDGKVVLLENLWEVKNPR